MNTTGMLTRRAALGLGLVGAAGLVAGCGAMETSGAPVPTSGPPAPPTTPESTPPPSPTPTPTPTRASNSEIIAAASVPVLCYHQVRPYESGDTEYNRQLLVIEPARYHEQIDAMKDAGFTTIDPADYEAYLTMGTPLPDKPVLLTFDDGKDNQPGAALPALIDRGMKGTWFIMTVVIGNSGWTTKEQVREMADEGIVIGSHTWDHHDVRKYAGDDFTTQFVESRATLQELSGQAVDTFAYPYGAWNTAALPPLDEAGYTTAFQLDEKPLDPDRPLLTLRRSLAVSSWSGDQVVEKLTELSKSSA
ncbi:MAG: polysaccharide deacetylase family protein [Mobilicoccus sp.]|nr:polysaccharide deacetylase family protein [Mobilicoccus sp.]